MNHMRNIKEMLNIPSGNRNVATSGYSSFTDSQFFFGSQFWPENSQSTSQEMSLSSLASQQSSQEGSDPKFSSTYHTKPLLFGELRDKNKAFGLLDKFEEDKKKAKDKTDSDILAKECQYFHETLNNIQQLVAGTERNTAVCQTVLEKIDNFASASQNNLNSLRSDVSQQLETLLNKVNSQKEMMTELEERVQKSGDTTVELGSNLQSLKNSVESLREEQERERNMLEEALKMLGTLTSEHSAKSSLERVMDSAIQTSPGLKQQFSKIQQDNKPEDTKLTRMPCNLEHNQAEVPPQDPKCIISKKKFTLSSRRRCKKRPLVLSGKSTHTVRDENTRPFMNTSKQRNISSPLAERRHLNVTTSQESVNPDCLIPLKRETRSITAGCLITPLSCWSQDSNSSVCLGGIEPILENLSAESKTGTPAKPEGLWQLFDMDCDSDLLF